MNDPRDDPQDEAEGLSPTVADGPGLSLGAGRGRNAPGAGIAEGFPAPPGRTFVDGQEIAARYRILRFLAAGGMGEVYEAEDLELEQRIALKTIHSAALGNHQMVLRFKREVQLARQVTHRNVCRLYDLVRLRPGSGLASVDGSTADAFASAPVPETPEGDVLFLTMELVRGESLAERLRRQGAMSVEQALPLVRQMAAGLAAAHDAGVVHRDFKCANVLLEPAADGATRAVITDFGIAGSHGDHGPAGTLTATGAFLGTPQYVAPEQLEGKEVGPATDVYALGIVLYEMLTGRLPFAGTTPMAVVVSRLTAPPPSPRLHVPDLEPRWEAAILRCLERDPAARFTSPADLLAALTEEPRKPPGRWSRWLVPAAAAMLAAAVLLAALASWRSRDREHPGPAATIAAEDATVAVAAATAMEPARRSVAVLEFQDLSANPDASWLSTALAQMLGMELSLGEDLRVVSAETVARAQRELGLAADQPLAADLLPRVHLNLGTDLLVLGEYLSLPGEGGQGLRVDVRVADAALGETVAAVTRSGQEHDLLEVVAETGRALREALGVGATTMAVAGGRGLPRDPTAARLHAEGVARLHRFDPVEARDLLERAVALEPTAPLLHSALAQAWHELGEESEAIAAARRALEGAGELPRQERFLVEGRFHEASGDWAGAAEAYGRLFAFFPDHLEYGLRLAHALVRGGKREEAAEILADLRRLPADSAEDPRVDLLAVSIADAAGDYQALQDAAVRATARAEARGALLLAAEARTMEAWAHVFLGRPDRGLDAARRARDIYQEVGHRPGLAAAMSAMAPILSLQGRHSEAAGVSQQAAAIYRAIGNHTKELQSLQNVAFDYLNKGDAVRARQAVAAVQERAATRPLDETREAQVLYLEGWLLTLEGRLTEAVELDRELIQRFEAVGDRRRVAQGHRRLGEALLAGGELEEARSHLARSVAIHQELGLDWYVAQNRVPLARAEAELGHLPVAEELARAALAAFDRQGSSDRAAEARALLARVLTAAHRAQEGREVLAPAMEAWPSLDNAPVRVAVAAAALAALPEPVAADRLAAAVAEAERQGAIESVLEGRLTQHSYELAIGAPGASEALLQLQRQARELGFGLVALRAAADDDEAPL